MKSLLAAWLDDDDDVIDTDNRKGPFNMHLLASKHQPQKLAGASDTKITKS